MATGKGSSAASVTCPGTGCGSVHVRVALGVGLGLVAALLLARLLGGLLYDVGAFDPVTFAAVALVLTGIALLASFIPARRASRLNPTDTLRSE